MAAKRAQDDFRWCRLFGHSWEDYNPVGRRSMFMRNVNMRCVHCASTRHDAISTVTGELLQRSYTHPPGYKNAGLNEKPTTYELRLWYARKNKVAIDRRTKDEMPKRAKPAKKTAKKTTKRTTTNGRKVSK